MRCCLFVGIVWVALVSAAPARSAPLLAAAPAAEGEVQGQRLGVEKGLFKGAVEVSLWTIVVFLTLFTVLRRFAWDKIRDGLDKREQAFARDKQEAENARREAAQLRDQLKQEMARANDQIRQMIDKARQDAQQTAAEELARGKAELQAERERQQRELKLSTDHALQEIWSQAAQLATLISTKAVRKQLSLDDHRGLVTEALTEFRAAAQTRHQDLESARA